MKKVLCSFLAIVFVLGFFSIALAGSVTLSWDANTESDLAGYRLFQREPGQAYNYSIPAWEGSTTTGAVTIPDGPYECYFVARAYDECKNESLDSNEVKHDTRSPAAPSLHSDTPNLCKADHDGDGIVAKQDKWLYLKDYRAELGRSDCLP